MPDTVPSSSRLKALFAETKLVCFGRYALEVPKEGQLIIGKASIPDDIEVFDGDFEAARARVSTDVERIKSENDSAEFTYNGVGPIENSWQIRYYESRSAKEVGLHFFTTYVTKDRNTFVLGDSVGQGETESQVIERQAELAKKLRLRGPDDVPVEPGFCVKNGFVADRVYARQEMTNAGIYLPSLPDVTFSISSNKDAYADYTPAEFEAKREKLSLLARIAQAKKSQGIAYPSRTLLREGKRDVQHWHGEESLIRRNDGVHDFEWAFVGTPKDVANPSEFSVHMYTKVAHNKVGAAKASSLSDDEAVALWDKLLSGLKFRAKVPGAPPGAYYFPQTNQQGGGTK